MASDAKTLGYLLMDPHSRYWFDPVAWLWVALSYVEPETGREVADFLPPPNAFHPDAAPARKAAADLQQQGVDVRAVRVRVPC